MGRFIPVEIFQKKSNTFRGITFFPFLPKRPKFSVPFVWIPVPGSKSRESEKFTGICKWYNLIPFLFSMPKKIPVRTFFTEISVQMVSVQGNG